MIEVFGILALVVVAPIWIIAHYTTEWRKQRGLSTEDEKMLDEVYDTMERMEERIRSLEKILDDENTGWRGEDEPDAAPRYPREAR